MQNMLEPDTNYFNLADLYFHLACINIVYMWNITCMSIFLSVRFSSILVIFFVFTQPFIIILFYYWSNIWIEHDWSGVPAFG